MMKKLHLIPRRSPPAALSAPWLRYLVGVCSTKLFGRGLSLPHPAYQPRRIVPGWRLRGEVRPQVGPDARSARLPDHRLLRRAHDLLGIFAEDAEVLMARIYCGPAAVYDGRLGGRSASWRLYARCTSSARATLVSASVHARIPRQPQAAELPARCGREEVAVAARTCPAGVTQEPPRSTYWLAMNLPLYSPTAPALPPGPEAAGRARRLLEVHSHDVAMRPAPPAATSHSNSVGRRAPAQRA